MAAHLALPSWLPGALAGATLTASHIAAWVARSPLVAPFPLKGNPMQFQEARAVGAHIGGEVAKIVGLGLGFVEGVMPGADPATKHAALARFIAGQLAALEKKTGDALNLSPVVLQEAIAFTTNQDAIAWVIAWFEQQATMSATATVPAAAPVDAAPPVPPLPSPQG